MSSSAYGLRCGFCGRPNFSTQELLELHIDSCAPVRGFVARFGTGVNAVGRRFECDPVSGLASLRPQHLHICPWCKATLHSAQEASNHRQSCIARRASQASYQPPQPFVKNPSPSFAAQPTKPGADMRQSYPQESNQQPHWNQQIPQIDPQLLGPQTQNWNLPPSTRRGQKSPYFEYSHADEQTLMNRINEPPSHVVTSLLVDIARSNAEARAIPEAAVSERLLPIAKPYPPYKPAPLPHLQPKPAPAPSPSLLRPMAPPKVKKQKAQAKPAKSPALKAKKPIRFTMCEGCDRYCKHPRIKEEEDVIYDI